MKKINDYRSYVSSPFSKLGISTRSYTPTEKTLATIVDTETGEERIFQELGKPKTIVHDALEYRKVYVSQLDLIKELSTPGLKVWTYMLKNLRVKSEEITISMSECIEFTGYSAANNVYKGICELLDLEVIARKVGMTGTYFINPNVFFNGRRI